MKQVMILLFIIGSFIADAAVAVNQNKPISIRAFVGGIAIILTCAALDELGKSEIAEPEFKELEFEPDFEEPQFVRVSVIPNPKLIEEKPMKLLTYIDLSKE